MGLLNMEAFEEEWQKRFGNYAQEYAAEHLVSGWSEHGLWRRVALFEALLKEHDLPVPAQVLELGCGAGTYVRFLANFGHLAVGLDYSLPSLKRALVADPQRSGHYAAGEAYRLPFGNARFDLVVSIGVLQVLWCPEQALDEMVRVLRPRGILVVEFLNAFESIALMRAAATRLSGRPPRVRTYSCFQVCRWFMQRGLRCVQRAGVYLPPRHFPWLGRLLAYPGVVHLLESLPGLALVAPHAFLLIGEKNCMVGEQR